MLEGNLTNQVIQPSLFTGEETEDQTEWFPWSFKESVVGPKPEVKQRTKQGGEFWMGAPDLSTLLLLIVLLPQPD